jgi:PGF-pre-PGF domain-containing protein
MNLNSVHGEISDNTIKNTPNFNSQYMQWGILLAAANNDIEVSGNTFEGLTGPGVDIYGNFDGSVRIADNEFSEFAEFGGILVTTTQLPESGFPAKPDDIDIVNNSFETGNGYGIQNDVGITIDATNNWWGDASGPGGEGPGSGANVSANVTFTPFLAFPPGEAPSDDTPADDTPAGGGGGGGGAFFPEEGEGPQPDRVVEETIVDEEPQTSDTTVEVEGTELVESVSFEEDIDSGTVEVSEFDDPPETVAEDVAEQAADSADTDGGAGTDVDVVGAVDISPSSETAETSSASVVFTVDADELDSPDNAVIMHEQSDGNWEPLDTSVRDVTGGTVTLVGQTSSFSQFAVVELSPAQVETPTPEATPADTGTPTPSEPGEETPATTPEPEAQADTGEAAGEGAAGTATPAASEEPAGFGLTAGLVIALLVALLVVVFALRRRDAL